MCYKLLSLTAVAMANLVRVSDGTVTGIGVQLPLD